MADKVRKLNPWEIIDTHPCACEQLENSYCFLSINWFTGVTFAYPYQAGDVAVTHQKLLGATEKEFGKIKRSVMALNIWPWTSAKHRRNNLVAK